MIDVLLPLKGLQQLATMGQIASQTGFRPGPHRLDFIGTCHDCDEHRGRPAIAGGVPRLPSVSAMRTDWEVPV
jgi:hypothetical protein